MAKKVRTLFKWTNKSNQTSKEAMEVSTEPKGLLSMNGIQQRSVFYCNNINLQHFLRGPLNQMSKNFKKAKEVLIEPKDLLSINGIELKKWLCNNDDVTVSITDDSKSIWKSNQFYVESNTEGTSVIGLQWISTDSILDFCSGIKKRSDYHNTEAGLFSGIFSI